MDLASVIHAALETVAPAAEAKGIRLQHVLDARAVPFRGDPNRLQQVVWNLLSNAIKFTPRGGRVQVHLEKVDSHLEISIGDTGQGIAPEFLPHVFERFRQADASTTRQHGGLGIGLAIVRELVELHGGSVRVKSPGVGQGTTFTINLPLAVVEAREGEPERVQPALAERGRGETSPPSLRGLKVLLVEDEPETRELLTRILRQFEADVVGVGSVAEALDRLEGERPDLIVSDIGMPGEDGYDLIRKVRARSPERGGRIPAVALTAFARPEDRQRALLSGFGTHLAKPVEPWEVVAVVAALAGRTGREAPSVPEEENEGGEKAPSPEENP